MTSYVPWYRIFCAPYVLMIICQHMKPEIVYHLYANAPCRHVRKTIATFPILRERMRAGQWRLEELDCEDETQKRVIYISKEFGDDLSLMAHQFAWHTHQMPFVPRLRDLLLTLKMEQGEDDATIIDLTTIVNLALIGPESGGQPVCIVEIKADCDLFCRLPVNNQ